MIPLIFFALLEIGLSGAFIFLFLRGETNEYLLGGLMAMQLLVVLGQHDQRYQQTAKLRKPSSLSIHSGVASCGPVCLPGSS